MHGTCLILWKKAWLQAQHVVFALCTTVGLGAFCILVHVERWHVFVVFLMNCGECCAPPESSAPCFALWQQQQQQQQWKEAMRSVVDGVGTKRTDEPEEHSTKTCALCEVLEVPRQRCVLWVCFGQQPITRCPILSCERGDAKTCDSSTATNNAHMHRVVFEPQQARDRVCLCQEVVFVHVHHWFAVHIG